MYKICKNVVFGIILEPVLWPLYFTMMVSNSQEALQMVLKALGSNVEVIKYSYLVIKPVYWSIYIPNMLKVRLWDNFRTRTVAPVLHQDAIKQSRSTTDGVKSTLEYFKGN